MSFLSKQVSHRSLGMGFIFKAHMICRSVTVGYNPSVASPARVSKNSLNLGCKYKASVSHSSISVQYVYFNLGLNLCWITANPLSPIKYNVHLE